MLTLIGAGRRGGALARGLRRALGAVAEAPPQGLMPYTLFQGGRRRRRRRAPAVLAAGAAARRPPSRRRCSSPTAAGGDESARDAPRAAAAPAAWTPLEPLAGGGTAPSPLAVRLEQGGDPVRARFKQHAARGAAVRRRHGPRAVAPPADARAADRVADEDDDRAGGRRPARPARAGADHARGAALPGSGVGLLPRGKRIRVETMLYGLLLPSGNDAAIALAQRAAGTRAAASSAR